MTLTGCAFAFSRRFDFPRLLLGCLFLEAAPLLAREIPITILHTCDLHGNVLPTQSYEDRTNVGGIARCATAIRQIRAEEKNVLLLDAGDTIQGAAISFLSDGQVMVKCLNHLRYDAWTWGNHEFDWGLEKLAACAERAEMPLLNANVSLLGGSGHEPAKRIVSRLKPYMLREIDGVKVAVLGLNTPGIPHWSRPSLIAGLRFEDSVDTLRKVVPEVRMAGARILVLVCHQGYREAGSDHANQVNEIARNFPELDVIIGGHTHRNFPEFKVGNILYCQANYFGIHLGRVDLVFDTEKGRVVKRRSNTLLMDERVPLDREVLQLAGAELDRAEKTLSTCVGEATGEFWTGPTPRRESPIHNLIFESIAEAFRGRGAKVDAIVHGVFDRRAVLKRGPVTVGDLWRVVPYENTLGVCHIREAALLEILEENATAYEKREFRGIWGLRWTFDPKSPVGRRTVSLRHADGTPIGKEEELAVVFNSYDLASGGLRWRKLREIADRPESRLVEYDIQTRQAVLDYVHLRAKIAPVVKGWWRTAGAAKPE